MTEEQRKGYNPLLKNYPDSVKINSVSEEAETLYTRLIAQSDDNANYDGEPQLVLAKLYARRWHKKQVSAQKVARWIKELEREGLIVLYVVADEKYLHVVDCFKRLRSDVNKDVRFPPFSPQAVITKGDTESVTETGRGRNGDGTCNHTIPYHTIPDNISVIFEKWNSYKGQGNWKSHRELSKEIGDAIKLRLKDYAVEQICGAIENYAKVLLGKEYKWSYAWTLQQFLTRHPKENRDELQLYRFLPNSFFNTDYLTNAAHRKSKKPQQTQSLRDKQRAEWTNFIKEAPEAKLVAVYKENTYGLRWLIDELRPGIKDNFGKGVK